MKKVLSLVGVLVAMGSLFVSSAFANDDIEGTYSVIKTYDFAAMAKADTTETGAAIKSGMTYDAETVKVGGTASNIGTGAYEGLAMQGADKFFLYTTGGLYSGNGGGRKVGVLDLAASTKVVIKTNGACMSLADATTAVEDSVSTVDGVTTYYYTMSSDGILALTMTRYFTIFSIDILAKTKQYTVKYWDFAAMAKADTTDTGAALKSGMTYDAETVKVGGTASNLGTGAYEGLAMQGADKFFLYTTGGLYSGNGGGRKVGVLDLEAGAKVTIKTNGECMTLSDESNAVLDAVSTVEGVTTYQYTMTVDGILALTMTRYFTIFSIQVDQNKQVIAKTYDFAAMAKADTTETGAAQKTAMTFDAETVKVGGTASNLGTGEFAGLAMQGADRFILNAGGLYSNNGGGRKVGVLDLAAETKVIIKTSGECMTLADATTAAEDSVSTVDGVTTYYYTMTADGILALTMTRYFAIYSIQIFAPKSDLQAPEISVVAHADWEVAPVVLSCKTNKAVIYYQLGDASDATVYSDTVFVKNSTTISAWSELGGKTSKLVTKNITAGFVAVPTATVTAVKDLTRTVTLADVATPAVISYAINDGDFQPYSEPFVISETSTIKAAAMVNDYLSDTLTTTIEAGVMVNCAGVTYSKVADPDSATAVLKDEALLYYFVVKADQSSVLCKPEVKIQYTLTPLGGETSAPVVVVPGDTIKDIPASTKLSAIAIAEGYANSEETHVWVKKPAELTAVWEEDFNALAEAYVESGQNFTVTYDETAFGSYSRATLSAAGDKSNPNIGFSSNMNALLRNHANGQAAATGLYSMASGGRTVAFNDVYAKQVLVLNSHNGQSESTSITATENLVLDAAASAGNEYVFTVTGNGVATINLPRYWYIHKVGVYNSSEVTSNPVIKVGKVDGTRRWVGISTITEHADIYYAIVETKEDNTQVIGEYQLYTEPFEITETTTVAAYANCMDVLSDVVTETIELDNQIIKLNRPVITWAGTTATFSATVDNSDVMAAPEADLYYTVAGGEEVKAEGEIVVPAANYGWMKVVAKAAGYEDSDPAWRYADGRESYTEPYLALYNASDTIPANIDKMGDVEIKAGLDLDSVPAAFKSAGRIYFHVATTNYYGNLVAPFAMSNTDLESGAVAVLDGNGKKLTRGTEYVVYNMVANTTGTPTSGTFANNELVNSLLLEGDGMVRTGNITAKGNFLVKVAEDIAGKDLILQSKAAQQFPTSTVSFVQPTAEGSWKLVANGRLETATADFDVYVLNETGTKFEKSRTVAPWQTAILLDAASTETIAEFVLVDNAVGIGNVDAPVFETGAIYDLQGRKVQKIQKGQIYIINGARFMTK
ncbi:MAG: hypothetical protein J6032_01440 [Bacteroidales bacterium]|nr:hypothetical protein [Bacteroidales bacterium]